MYAVRKLHVKQWDFQKPEERYTVQIAYGGKPVSGIQADRISVVEEEVMYWRKANHIHGWFVQNVQGGIDNCGTYYVSRDVLRKLYVVCDQVMGASKLVKGSVLTSRVWNHKHKTWDEHREPGKVIEDSTRAKQLLPRSEGFFFGYGEYDEDYLDHVVATRDWAMQMLADSAKKVPGDIYYHSSW